LAIPFYRELSVKHVWETFKQNEAIMEYMPDYEDDELPERTFLYTIVATIYPNETERLVQNCRAKRSLKETKEKDELVEITEEIKGEIDSLLHHPSKFHQELLLSQFV
jgi:hypothetical protein